MNKVILMGRLTRDPEIRYSQATNVAVARFSLAVDRRFKREGEESTDFFNCTAFGKLAEFTEKYLVKGVKIVLTGRIQNNNYTNRNGEKVYSVEIMAEEMEFAESKKAAEANGAYNAPSNQSSAPQPSVAPGDGFINIEQGIEDELPF